VLCKQGVTGSIPVTSTNLISAFSSTYAATFAAFSGQSGQLPLWVLDILGFDFAKRVFESESGKTMALVNAAAAVFSYKLLNRTLASETFDHSKVNNSRSPVLSFPAVAKAIGKAIIVKAYGWTR